MKGAGIWRGWGWNWVGWGWDRYIYPHPNYSFKICHWMPPEDAQLVVIVEFRISSRDGASCRYNFANLSLDGGEYAMCAFQLDELDEWQFSLENLKKRKLGHPEQVRLQISWRGGEVGGMHTAIDMLKSSRWMVGFDVRFGFLFRSKMVLVVIVHFRQ